MFIRLLLLFTIVPILELALLIQLGSYVGLLPTIGLIAVTGVVGASLARSQGFLVVNQIRNKLAAGSLPADSLIEGLLILIGGGLLLTPGLLTDITGFSLIIPLTRKAIRRLVKKTLKKQIDKGNIQFSFFGGNKGNSDSQQYNWQQTDEEDDWDNLSESIDVNYEEVDDESKEDNDDNKA
ncbi:FxsA family protein [Acetohalobium arabaticum]|uniref:FxsA cytoplasmic membrane protein n=1 Tax=Acetohalobium arabaticum (strain ATCC 49924 / DSM 5501 / Z-7288) TaxID=574087 RepID=D9QS36_ACEAZ|nr:FxsA family protein [Acetohalobium arabaticum]ADL13327.1 FxsA cytoplasmic membrane protein [Acetohalobium arabaticum DSM 5501]